MLVQPRSFRRPSRFAWVLLVFSATVLGLLAMTIGWGFVAALSLSGGTTFRGPWGSGEEFFDYKVKRSLACTSVQTSWNPTALGTTRSGEHLAHSVAPLSVPSHIQTLIVFEDPYRSYQALEFGVPFRFLIFVGRMTGPGASPFQNGDMSLVVWRAAAVDLLIHIGLSLVALLLIRSAVLRWRFRRRTRRGECGFCGYSLEGTQDTRCPECGSLRP